VTQIELLRFVLGALERLQIPYAIVGSYATSVWGDARLTRDIDIVVQLGSTQVKELCEAFPAHEFYVSLPAAEQAVRDAGQFNVIHFRSSNKIDFMVIGNSEWAQAQLSRRRKVTFLPDCDGFVAAPEDVIIGKLLYYKDGGSEKHLRDIATILNQSADDVDRRYVDEFARKMGLAEVWRIASAVGP
jgi:hypothetical protein